MLSPTHSPLSSISSSSLVFSLFPEKIKMVEDHNNKVVYSEKHEVTYGTAQGSCLGPLLFVIFCNDMYMLPILGKLILFADDTTQLENHRNKRF